MKDYAVQRSHGVTIRFEDEDGTNQLVGAAEPYEVLNPSGVPIAYGMSWRTARKVADALNAVRDIGWLS